MKFDFEITHFGIFDSTVKFENRNLSKKRVVGFFEFELFQTSTNRQSYIDDCAVTREKGTLICAKPGQVRYSELPFRCHYLHLFSENAEFISLMNNLPNSIVIHDVDRMTQMFEELLKFEGDSPEEIFGRQSAACKLIGFILHSASVSGKDSSPALLLHSKPLLKVADIIKHHFSEKLTLQQLAEVANLSPIYFHKLFCERFGKTPNKYILEHRIEAARLALLSDNVSIGRVAEDCGFSSQAYFNHKFKEVMGMTPLEYRKSVLGRMKL